MLLDAKHQLLELPHRVNWGSPHRGSVPLEPPPSPAPWRPRGQVLVLWNCLESQWIILCWEAGGHSAWDHPVQRCLWGRVASWGQQVGSYPCPWGKKNQLLQVRGGEGKGGMPPRGFCLVRRLLYKWPWNLAGKVETDLMRQKMGKKGKAQGWQIKVRNWCPSNRRQEEKRFFLTPSILLWVAYPSWVSLLNPQGAYPSHRQPAPLFPPLSFCPPALLLTDGSTHEHFFSCFWC